MSVNEGSHPDNDSQCKGCDEWFADQVLTRCKCESLLCPSCLKETCVPPPVPPTQPVSEEYAERLKGNWEHARNVLQDVMAELRIVRDSSKGSMFEQVAHELRAAVLQRAPQQEKK